MARGGKRPGAGRNGNNFTNDPDKPMDKNAGRHSDAERDALRERAKTASDLMGSVEKSPIEVMLLVMREAALTDEKTNKMTNPSMALSAAIAAAPYLHPKLATVDPGSLGQKSHEEELLELDELEEEEVDGDER